MSGKSGWNFHWQHFGDWTTTFDKVYHVIPVLWVSNL